MLFIKQLYAPYICKIIFQRFYLVSHLQSFLYDLLKRTVEVKLLVSVAGTEMFIW